MYIYLYLQFHPISPNFCEFSFSFHRIAWPLCCPHQLPRTVRWAPGSLCLWNLDLRGGMGWADGRENFDSVSPFLIFFVDLPCLIREKHRTTKPRKTMGNHGKPFNQIAKHPTAHREVFFALWKGPEAAAGWDRDASAEEELAHFFPLEVT